MAPKGSRIGGESGKGGQTILPSRPYFGAILEAQPLPTIFFGRDGLGIMHNEAAAHLLTPGPDGQRRVLAQDGTDLWTIVAARSDEADPLFDVRVRLRVAGTETLDTSLSIAPLRGSEGVLNGAIVFVLSTPAERLRAPGHAAGSAPALGFSRVVERLGVLLGAAHIYVVEIDPDFRAEGRVVAAWSADGSELPAEPFALRGTPSDSFGGRRMLCVPSGLAQMYPDDPTLEDGEYQAYVGIALTNAADEPIGTLAGLWREPLADVPGTCAAFTITGAETAQLLSSLLTERELRESEQRYGSVFEGSAVPILLIEPGTTQVVDANPAACAQYGYSRDEFMAMSVLQVDAQAPDVLRGELERAAEGTRSKFIGRHILAEGRVRDVEMSIGPIMVASRRLLYAMISDITERRRMEAELERSRRNLELAVAQRTEDLLRANAELQQASTARDMVFVNLAQELRTSLQTITGFSGLLLEGLAGDLTEEQRRQIEMVQQAGKRLATFATSLIESHRLEERELICEPEEFDLVSLVESVLFGLTSFAEDKGLRLRLKAAERPIDVETDRYKLQQILLNLLSNAIRYTGTGGVTVTVSRDDGEESTVAVADTGPGLASDRLETLFDGPEVHDSAAGIGLPASQRIAAALGGLITVESVLTRGSVFTVHLPPNCGRPHEDPGT